MPSGTLPDMTAIGPNAPDLTSDRPDGDRALQLLGAAGPHPDLGDEAALYGRFVGSWEVANRYLDDSIGRWRVNSFEWAFGWVLDGRGVQDVIRVPPDQMPNGQPGIGTTIRVHDRSIGAWRVNWSGATTGQFCTLIGNAHGEEIRQDGTGTDGRPIRWNFSEITRESFRWCGYVSDDGGVTWKLEQEMRARRRSPSEVDPGPAQPRPARRRS